MEIHINLFWEDGNIAIGAIDFIGSAEVNWPQWIWV